ncbi:tudor domain-containing protein 5 [Trichonephila inaurata madagascariensis]|uniref:Tudor domain-containing protein 5 n=1 Tax=Trichonephila inaurata madagascariensis TaxID=2747483 RepID=A0A8X6Y2K7_9ARAC|nr:tudor domain-containing protein 5 [Trichonephila inaurata madagascariensis]
MGTVLLTKGIMRQLNFDNVKKEIRSVLISAKEGLTVQEFLKEYRSLENRDGSIFLKGIADETTEHIQKLVLKQKYVKKKTPNKGYITNISRHNQTSAPVNINRYRPFVPAPLRAEIIQIVKQHPQGIGYPTLTFEYNKTFSKCLSLMWLSSNPAERLEKLVNAVPELKLITINNTQKLSYVDNDQDVLEETDVSRSKHQNMKDTVPMSFPTSQPLSLVIPMSVRRNIERVLKLFCKGILDKHFPILYQTCTNQTFDLHELGFTSLIDLTDALPEIFLRVKGKNPNDWLLFHVDNSKYVPENLEISNIKTSSDIYVSEEDVLKDIALPSSKYIQLNLPGEIETKFIPVFISAIINPNCFWFQLYTKEAIQRLKSLEKEMENFYNKLPSGSYKIANSHITVGAICALFCKDDSQWYRIVVTDIPTIDDVVVDFVDYGTSEKVPRHHLYYLRKSFTHLPAQAFQAELAFVKSANKGSEWDLAAQKRFNDLCNRPYLMAQVNSINNSVASLFLCDSTGEDDIHINDVLVQEGHAEYCASQTSDYDSCSELLSDECSSNSSLPTNLLQNEMVTSENNCFSEKANTSVNSQSEYQGSHHESSQFFCKRVLLDENYFIHILSVRNEAYVSGSDICNLFWANKSEHRLADRLNCKDVIVPTLSVSREEFKDLFEKCERYSVKGFHEIWSLYILLNML